MVKKEEFTGLKKKILNLYWEDGIMEMFQGIFFIFYMEMLLVVLTGTRSSFMKSQYIVFLPLFLYLPKYLKKSVVYPRLGAFDFEYKLDMSYWLYFVLPIAFIPMICFLIIKFNPDLLNNEMLLKWLPTVYGILFAGVFYDQLKKAGSNMCYLYSMFSISFGIIVSFLEFEISETRIYLFFIAISILVFASGLYSLIRFLNKYPVMKEEGENG